MFRPCIIVGVCKQCNKALTKCAFKWLFSATIITAKTIMIALIRLVAITIKATIRF